jgi:hypothetical protein
MILKVRNKLNTRDLKMVVVAMLSMILTAACAANYGRLERVPEITQLC